MSSEELRLFDKVTVFLDEDFSSAEHFTVHQININFIFQLFFFLYKLIFQALGNFYFVHESVKDVFIWDFQGIVN